MLKILFFKFVKKMIVLLIGLALGCAVAAITSCNKEYIEHPSCYRYIELTDRFDAELNYVKTDTSYPNGQQSNVVCNDDTLKLMNYKPDTVGCANGYQSVRYQILK